MPKQQSKTAYVCTECGYDSPKYLGKCPSCGMWDTLREIALEPAAGSAAGLEQASRIVSDSPPEALNSISVEDEIRFDTGYGELDRVLGGGAVKGSLVLLGGAPGIGKSTLMLQISEKLSSYGKVLYASGEESKRQVKLRADRLGVRSSSLLIMSETRLEAVLDAVDRVKPDVLVIDSIQTIYKQSVSASPGNVTQIKECTMTLLRLSKGSGIIVFIVGHVNKDGEIAGPKIMEHMVDCVLYFEGEQQNSYRILRAAKNRFGSTNEIGVFEMCSDGLREVPNPSAALLAGRPIGVPGTCITAAMEGTRPVLAEVQALVSPSVYGNPRRMAAGIDYSRSALLIAVLEKRGGLLIGNCDAYINVIGGLTLDEPAVDLATVIALASSFRDKPVDCETLAIGEVGLTGELRRVSNLEQRFSEAARMNMRRCICPAYGALPDSIPDTLQIIKAANIRQAIEAALSE